MKKIFLTAIVAASLPFLFTSCLEDVEVTANMTEDVKQDLASKDPDKIFAAAEAGISVNLQSYVKQDISHNYFGQKSFDYLTSLMGNDMVMTGRFAMSIFHHLCDYRGKDYVATANRWAEYYTAIDGANKIIVSIAEDETNAATLRYKAVALAYRGYAYLQLASLYQYPYYLGAEGTKWGVSSVYANNAERPCVPIITESITGHQPRSTVQEVHDLIISDLTTAYELFESTGNLKTATPTDFDGTVAAMYLTRVYMLMHDWDNAIKYADVVIDNYPVLTTEAEITQGFSSLSLPDVVFGCDITTENSTLYMSWFSQMDAYGDGYAGIGVWRAGFKPFVDRIASSDIRSTWFCSGATLRDTKDKPCSVPYQSVKFIGTGRDNIKAGKYAGWELGDYIYLRSEEAHYNKAEALAHKGDLTGAASVLNAINVTRDPAYNCTLSDKADLIEEINFQKRVEFWGEGIEYLDNRRLNIPVDRTDATWGSANNHFDGAKVNFTQDANNFVYQIPQTEINANNALTDADQNL